MMKKCLVGLLVLGYALAYADSAKIIDQPTIDRAQTVISVELAAIHKKRVILGCLSAAVLVAGGYGMYCWWPSYPKPASDDHKQALSIDKPQSQVSESYLHWMKRKFGDGTGGAISMIPYVVMYTIVGSITAAVGSKTFDVLKDCCRSLDWHWMVHERSKLYLLLGNFKYAAATLDPKSSLFDSLTQVTVNIADYTSATNNTGHLSMSGLDELIRLRSCAQKINEQQRAFFEKRLQTIWGLVVEAIALNLGFIAYKLQQDKDCSEFDRHQLEVMRDQLVEYTNTTAQQLSMSMQQTTTESSGGLLALICGYCNYVAHTCSVLEINPIISG